MTTPSPDPSRIAADGEQRAGIAAVVWSLVAAFTALIVGYINGRSSAADGSMFLDNPGQLPVGMAISGATVGVLVGALLFAALYVLLLRKTDIGSGKIALLIMAAGAFGAITGVMLIAFPAREIVLIGAASRNASAQDFNSFAKRADQPDLISPLNFQKPADIATAAAKARILQGLIVERQERLRRRHADTLVAIARKAEGRPGMAKSAGKFAATYRRDDERLTRYWALRLTYYQQVEKAGEWMASRPSEWRFENGDPVFVSTSALLAWRARIDRVKAVGVEADLLLKEINRANQNP